MAEQLQGGIDYTQHPYNSKVPDAPVVLTSVASLLRTSIKDVGNLCKSDNINKWSKHKPVRDSRLFPPYTDRFFLQPENISSQIIYGMYVTQDASMNKNANDLYTDDESIGNWLYLKPRGVGGGVTEPYRLGDFRGYYHKASPLCTSIDMLQDDTMNIRVGQTQQKIDKLRFFVEGAHDTFGSITFSDLNDLGVQEGDAKLVLCANVFDFTYYKFYEVINDNILLRTDNQPSTLKERSSDGSDYDDGIDRWKFVDVEIPSTFYEASKTQHTNIYCVHVILTLDFVKYDDNDGQWKSLRKIVIPWDDKHYFEKDIYIEKLVNTFQVLAREVQYGTNPTSPTEKTLWQNVEQGLRFYDFFRSPRIRFDVIHMSDKDAITFGGTAPGYKLVCKTKNGTYEVVGTLKDRNGNDLDSQTLQKSNNQYVTDSVYFEFTNLFPDGENAYLRNGTRYYADLYLVNYQTGYNEFIGNFSLRLSNS